MTPMALAHNSLLTAMGGHWAALGVQPVQFAGGRLQGGVG